MGAQDPCQWKAAATGLQMPRPLRSGAVPLGSTATTNPGRSQKPQDRATHGGVVAETLALQQARLLAAAPAGVGVATGRAETGARKRRETESGLMEAGSYGWIS